MGYRAYHASGIRLEHVYNGLDRFFSSEFFGDFEIIARSGIITDMETLRLHGLSESSRVGGLPKNIRKRISEIGIGGERVEAVSITLNTPRDVLREVGFDPKLVRAEDFQMPVHFHLGLNPIHEESEGNYEFGMPRIEVGSAHLRDYGLTLREAKETRDVHMPALDERVYGEMAEVFEFLKIPA